MATTRLSHNTRAVITGAGSGIGKAFAIELAARGGQVVCADINAQSATDTAQEIIRQRERAIGVGCDVSQLEDVEALAHTASEWLDGPLNFVINNAGVGVGGTPVESISMEDWRWIMGVNLWGVIHGCRVFVPLLKMAPRAAILNVASAASFGGAPLMGAYNTTKAAVVALSETLHAELAGSGVHVSVLCPTFVQTDILRHGRMPGGLSEYAQKMMNRSGMSPDTLAQKTLDGMDHGGIHILPQWDAKASWLIKRLVPGTFTRGMGLATRFLPTLSNGKPIP